MFLVPPRKGMEGKGNKKEIIVLPLPSTISPARSGRVDEEGDGESNIHKSITIPQRRHINKRL